jgi:hypothetical protein
MHTHYQPSVQWESAFFVPPIWKVEIIHSTQPPQRNDEPTNGPPRPFALSLHDHYLLWSELQICRFFTLRSPVLRKSPATRRPSRGLSGKAPRPPWRSLDRERTTSPTQRVRFYRVPRSTESRSDPVIYQSQTIKTDQAIPCVFQRISPSSFAKHGLRTRAALVAKHERLHVMSIIAGEVEPLGPTRLSPLPS